MAKKSKTEAVEAAAEEQPNEQELDPLNRGTKLDEDVIGDLMADEPDDDDDIVEEVAAEADDDPAKKGEGEPEEAEKPEAEAKPEEAPAEKPEEGKPEEKPKEEPKVEAEKPAEAAKPEEKEEKEPTTQPAPDAAPEKTAEELAAEQQKWRDDTVQRLADEHFTISDEDREALDISEDGAKALSKLASGLFLDAVQGATVALVGQLPQILTVHQQNASRTQDLERKFFDAWPKLDMGKHGNTLYNLGTAFRQANPEASDEEFIKLVGAQAMVAERIPFEESVAKPIEDEVERTAPPHQPPRGTPGSAKPKPENPFAQFTEDIIAEDLE